MAGLRRGHRRRLPLEDVRLHIDHALNICGEDEDNAPFVPELNSVRRLETVADMMSSRGHPDRIIEKVLGTNWLRVFGEVWG